MEPYLREYEEYKTLPPFWGWVLLFAICVFLIEFGHLHHHVIQDAVRTWNFGVLPLVPGESKYSTSALPAQTVPLQMHALPEAHPRAKLPPDTALPFPVHGGCAK